MHSEGNTRSMDINQVFFLMNFSLADFFQKESAFCSDSYCSEELLYVDGYSCGAEEAFVCGSSCGARKFSARSNFHSTEKSFACGLFVHNLDQSVVYTEYETKTEAKNGPLHPVEVRIVFKS
ncbi:hypothetical protein C2G38_2162811 [Gigaspora rosea]|uniref:Uncharacterized protein n=1 Tax=Gigaspora rosea TaxID=44941 RepID=A0A397VXX1_9GLOM|nr:hypothetical protein C2G38_2162811 [Gigaspora rosea]